MDEQQRLRIWPLAPCMDEMHVLPIFKPGEVVRPTVQACLERIMRPLADPLFFYLHRSWSAQTGAVERSHVKGGHVPS